MAAKAHDADLSQRLSSLLSGAPVQLDFRVCDAPLEEPKSVPARLAPEGINVKEAHQTFRTDPTDALNVFARAFWTNSFRHRGGWEQLKFSQNLLSLSVIFFFRY